MTQYHDTFMQWYHKRAACLTAHESRQTAAKPAAIEPAGVDAGHDCQTASEAASGDSSQVSSECALASAAHASATDRATAADESAGATQEAAAEATQDADLSAESVIEGSESASLLPAVTCMSPCCPTQLFRKQQALILRRR